MTEGLGDGKGRILPYEDPVELIYIGIDAGLALIESGINQSLISSSTHKAPESVGLHIVWLVKIVNGLDGKVSWVNVTIFYGIRHKSVV